MFRKICSFLLLFAIFFLCTPSSAKVKMEENNYDIVIIGAGLSGVSAAISAARFGSRVLVVEDSDVVGGQAVASAVSTMDDLKETRHGNYIEFINMAMTHYKNSNTPTNICLWGGDTFAFEPKYINNTLQGLMKDTKKITLALGTKVVSATVDGNRVTAIEIEKNRVREKVTAKIFIDATECGDFIPLTGANFRVGKNLYSPDVPESIIQDITYSAVVKKYDTLPRELFLENKPPHYDEYVEEFRRMVTKDGNFFPGTFPFNAETNAAYRAMPNEEDPNRARVDATNSASWKYISRTGINWPNDWPGNKIGVKVTKDSPSLSTKFLTNEQYRLLQTRAALVKTLCFIYYMQHELGLENWGVDNTQDFGNVVSCDLRNWHDLPREFLPSVKCFPPKPYVRESNRIVGLYTMTSKDVRRDAKVKRTLFSNPDAIALGEYPADIHGEWNIDNHETDMIDDGADFVKPKTWEARLFQVPIGVLIPEKIDGLLAAEKNISVSRLVNGAIRLHPIVFHTGQATGVLASLAVKLGVSARDVPTIFVQSKLLEQWSNLSIWRLKDVAPTLPHYKEITLALVYNVMTPTTENSFCPTQPVKWQEFCQTIYTLAPIHVCLTREQKQIVITGQDANKLLAEQSENVPILKQIALPEKNLDKPVRRSDLARLVYQILLKQAEIDSGLTYPKK